MDQNLLKCIANTILLNKLQTSASIGGGGGSMRMGPGGEGSLAHYAGG